MLIILGEDSFEISIVYAHLNLSVCFMYGHDAG